MFVPGVHDWPRSDQLALIGDAASLVAVLIGFGAIFVAWFTLRKGNRNSSAATVVALHEAFQAGWRRFLRAEGQERDDAFSDLLNLFEIACGIECEGSLAGVSQELMSRYLRDCLKLIERDEYAYSRLREDACDDSTFKYIYRYVNKRINLKSAA